MDFEFVLVNLALDTIEVITIAFQFVNTIIYSTYFLIQTFIIM